MLSSHNIVFVHFVGRVFMRKTWCSVRHLDATITAAIRVWKWVLEYTLSIPFRSNVRFYWRSGWPIFAGRSSLRQPAVLGAFHCRRVRGRSVRQICRTIARKSSSTTSEGRCLSGFPTEFSFTATVETDDAGDVVQQQQSQAQSKAQAGGSSRRRRAEFPTGGHLRKPRLTSITRRKKGLEEVIYHM